MMSVIFSLLLLCIQEPDLSRMKQAAPGWIAGGQATLALRRLTSLSTAHPDDAELRILTGEAYYALDRFEEAVTSFEAAVKDPRVVGAVLMNPQGFDGSSAWNAHVKSRKWMREYLKKLFSLKAWGRALSGKSRYGRFLGLLLFRMKSRVKRDDEVTTVAGNLANEAATLIARKVRLLFLMTPGDESNDFFRTIMGSRSGSLRRSPLVEQQTITGSDHTFTCLGHQEQVLLKIAEWLEGMRRKGANADNTALPAEPEGIRQ